MSTEPQARRGRSGPIRLLVAAGVVGLVFWFALDNRRRVTVDWWVFERGSRLIYVILVSALLGAVADRLVVRRRRGRQSGS